MRNKKGFTLVEIIAVIVILAILMVSAGTGVMSVLNNSKINTFKNEVMVMVRGAESMYTAVSMDPAKFSRYVVKDSTKTSVAICVTLPGLVSNSYLEKDIKNYSGVILVEVPTNGTQPRTTVWAHNGKYAINGIEATQIDALRYKKGNNNLGRPNNGGNTGDKADKISGGPLGLVTDLRGVKLVAVAAYGHVNPIGMPSGLKNGTPSTNPRISVVSYAGHGGTGKSYNNIPCINAKL